MKKPAARPVHSESFSLYPGKTGGGAGQAFRRNSVQFYSELTGQPALTIETGEENARFPMEDALLEKTYREIRMIPLGILQLC